MNALEFSTLNIGDIVYAVINPGTWGISKYQYSSITKCHATDEMLHVFLSPYLVSTILIIVGNEGGSRRLKDLFLTEAEAKEWQNKCKLSQIE